jgi:hypothetical protein
VEGFCFVIFVTDLNRPNAGKVDIKFLFPSTFGLLYIKNLERAKIEEYDG